MAGPTSDGLLKWQSHRRSLRRWWWFYLAIAVVGGVWFIRNLTVGDSNLFAALLLIPLIALRQAWKTDRQLVECDREFRKFDDSSSFGSREEDADV
jgi:hypothetical protein